MKPFVEVVTPHLPSLSFYPDVVKKVKFKYNDWWPTEILAAMFNCEDDLTSDGYYKNGSIGISGALIMIHLEKNSISRIKKS